MLDFKLEMQNFKEMTCMQMERCKHLTKFVTDFKKWLKNAKKCVERD